MPKKEAPMSHKIFIIAGVCVLIIAVLLVGLKLRTKEPPKSAGKNGSEKVRKPVKARSVIDYSKLEKDEALKDLMKKRKEEFGVGKGIDMIAKSDEAIKVGDSTVPMEDVIEKIRLKEGDIVEKDIGSETAGSTARKKFGIYVVQPGDNIWNIHFRFLTEYFEKKGIAVSPLADETDSAGLSSGVGKLLKFSEKMVYIYNIDEGKLDVKLDTIRPYSKVVIYSMDQVFALLNQIDYGYVNRIQFDGMNIWIPGEQ
ncbi:hypothetical protein ACFL9U_06685 [Thermodesulfobacteriota bacterium]